MNVGDRDDALAVTRKVNGFMYKVCVGVGVTRSVCVSVSLFLSLSLCLSLSLSACISSVLSYPNAPSPSSLTTTHTLHTQPSFITYLKITAAVAWGSADKVAELLRTCYVTGNRGLKMHL